MNRHSFLDKDKIKQVSVKALVDSGAYNLCINETVRTQLGLPFLEKQIVTLANESLLDVDFVEMREGFLDYLPIGGVIGLILLVETILLVGAWTISPDLIAHASAPAAGDITNTQAIGQILYTKYVFFFQMAGLILLVAMVGAIVLTMRHKPNVKRQLIADQVARGPATAVEIKSVKSGEGI